MEPQTDTTGGSAAPRTGHGQPSLKVVRPVHEPSRDAVQSRARLAARYTGFLLEVARAKGLDRAALFGDEPVFATRGRSPKWGHEDLSLVSKNLRRITDDELWGLIPGERIPVATIKFASELALVSQTLGEGLTRAFKLYELLGPLRFRLEASGDLASIVMTIPKVGRYEAAFLYEWWLWLWHYLSQWFVRAEIGLVRVSLPHGPWGDPADYAGTFGSRCSFGAEEARVTFARSELARPITRGLDELEEFFARTRVTLDYAPEVESSVSTSIKIVLMRRLQHDRALPTLEELAAEKGVTSQTLRRWLIAEGVSYRALKAEVRGIIARRHLSRPEASLSEVAARAGFAETSAFTRAFRSWTGVSVSEFRRNLGYADVAPDELPIEEALPTNSGD
jgi:AraC-like DNA-binding protein